MSFEPRQAVHQWAGTMSCIYTLKRRFLFFEKGSQEEQSENTPNHVSLEHKRRKEDKIYIFWRS